MAVVTISLNHHLTVLKKLHMAAFKAVIIALSMVVVAIIYSDIVEDEEETYIEESSKFTRSIVVTILVSTT